MARKRSSLRLGIFLNSRRVGYLTQEASGAVDFRYASEWLEWQNTFAISLSLPLREDRYIGAPVTVVFDNLLPENLAIRKKIAERVGAGGTDPVSMLAALGRDCVGALQFLPEGMAPGPAGVVEGKAISEAEIAEILRNLATTPLGVDQHRDFRISIAGAQEKTALLKRRGRWQLPTGATPTTHILKPQIGKLSNGLDFSNSVENEYLCLKLTAAFGLPTADVEMHRFEDQRVLVVERFDRIWTADGRLLRIPQEDMCQALGVPWTIKYQSEGGPGIPEIAELLAGSDEPTLDRRTFFKANVLFWLLGATDGHAKNFSVALSSGGGFRLTKLYDVLSLQPNVDAKLVRLKDFRLAMSIGKTRHYGVNDIHRRHFLETAEGAGLGARNAASLIEELIAEAPEAVRRVSAKLPRDFPEVIATSIFNGVKARTDLLQRAR